LRLSVGIAAGYVATRTGFLFDTLAVEAALRSRCSSVTDANLHSENKGVLELGEVHPRGGLVG
jgi:hypothetical protein